MTGRYEISVSFDGYYSFSLYVGSGAPLLTGTAHTTLPLCRKGIASVRLNSDAPLEDIADDAEAADVLERSESICHQAEAHYNEAMEKPWFYLPGRLMGFRPLDGGEGKRCA